MPIYEYQCLKCGKHFEKLQKISDEPMSSCPECGGETKRMVSQTSFTLKGEGWYRDGYASKRGKAAEQKNSTPSSPETKKSDTPKKETT